MFSPFIAMIVMATAVCLWAVSKASASDRGVLEFYVSPKGDDAWSGRLADPAASGNDGPFATLDTARDAIRRLPRDARAGATVYIRGGTYVRERSFVLTPDDSGAPGAPVVYRGYPGEQAVLVGGREVTGWRKVTDEAVLTRLPAEAHGKVYQADLKAQGITDYGRLGPRGFNRPTVPAALELFFNDRPMTLARWPNDGFVKIAGVPREGARLDRLRREIGGLETGFLYEGDRPRQWKDHTGVWVHGYWMEDWADSHEKVLQIDLDRRLIRTAAPYGVYAFRPGQRFYWLNVLEELDSPGEWYLDEGEGMLYFWPPAPLQSGGAWVSLIQEPLIRTDGASRIQFRGLTLQCTRGRAVEIRDGEQCLVADCTIRSIGTDAVEIAGGREHTVTGCEVYDTGDAGIRASGGDRRTLTPCGHLIHNNHLHHIARWSRCCQPAIGLSGIGIQASLSGVGIRVSHNLIHDHPHCAILFDGNDNVIEFNEIHHIALETGDVGAIYVGRDWTFLGNVVRYNYIHDTGGVGQGSMGVYLDDSAGGVLVHGNVFWKVQRAVLIGGGRYNTVENNIFVDCDPAVQIDGRGLDKTPAWHNQVYKTLKNRLEAMNYKQPPYSTRHPELQELDGYLATPDGVPPEGNRVLRNICVGKWVELRWNAKPEMVDVRDNFTDGAALLVDAANGDFRLRPDSPALKLGFRPIPIDRIGLIRRQP